MNTLFGMSPVIFVVAVIIAVVYALFMFCLPFFVFGISNEMRKQSIILEQILINIKGKPNSDEMPKV